MYYSYKGSYPTQELPSRIRLLDGSTRTLGEEMFTQEDLEQAGYKIVNNPPPYNPENQFLAYEYQEASDDFEWLVKTISIEVMSMEVRRKRDNLIEEVMWRVYRYNRESRLGLNPTDDINALDQYIQALCDVPQQQGFPYDVNWPTLGD